MFGIRRNPHTRICPVKGIKLYMKTARQMRVDLTSRYLFRPTTPNGGIQNLPLSSSTAEVRLRAYLRDMGIFKGETLHGFRSGCAITLALKGAELSEIMEHVGWSRRHAALYYTQLAKVLSPDSSSARLSDTDLSNVTDSWRDMNQLKRFVCAFPCAKQQRTSSEEPNILGQNN